MARLTNPARFRPNSRPAAVLVEAALVMTLLITLTMGLLQYGWVFIKWSQIQDATRQGARVGVLPTSNSDSIHNASNTGTIDTVMAGDGMGSSGYSVHIYVTHNGTKSEANLSSAVTGDLITVVVQVTYTNVEVFSVATSLFPSPSTLTATVTMTREGS